MRAVSTKPTLRDAILECAIAVAGREAVVALGRGELDVARERQRQVRQLMERRSPGALARLESTRGISPRRQRRWRMAP